MIQLECDAEMSKKSLQSNLSQFVYLNHLSDAAGGTLSCPICAQELHDEVSSASQIYNIVSTFRESCNIV